MNEPTQTDAADVVFPEEFAGQVAEVIARSDDPLQPDAIDQAEALKPFESDVPLSDTLEKWRMACAAGMAAERKRNAMKLQEDLPVFLAPPDGEDRAHHDAVAKLKQVAQQLQESVDDIHVNATILQAFDTDRTALLIDARKRNDELAASVETLESDLVKTRADLERAKVTSGRLYIELCQKNQDLGRLQTDLKRTEAERNEARLAFSKLEELVAVRDSDFGQAETHKRIGRRIILLGLVLWAAAIVIAVAAIV